MPNWELVDDASPQVGYSSGWSNLAGSTRQWEGAVHTTDQSGATATLRFKGVAIHVYVTVPDSSSSSAIQRATISIDGGAPVNATRQALSSAQYDVLLFETDELPEEVHTIIVANAGGDVPLQLDKFEYLPGERDPLPAPLYPETTSLSSSGAETHRTSTSTITDSNGNVSTSIAAVGGAGGLSTGGIVGIALGCLALVAGIALVLILFACRRRRRKKNEMEKVERYDPNSAPPSQLFADAMVSGTTHTKQRLAQQDSSLSDHNASATGTGSLSPTGTTVTQYPSMMERETNRTSLGTPSRHPEEGSGVYNASSEEVEGSTMYAQTVRDPPPAYQVASSTAQSLAVDVSIASIPVVEGKSSSH